jgi:flagellin
LDLFVNNAKRFGQTQVEDQGAPERMTSARRRNMALSVNTNVGALNALASSNSTTKMLETSMARLASGKRINSAGDDAAGSAIASRLSSEITGTKMAIRNTLDAQALIDTAEGAHSEVVNILQRMRELAVQASSDTNDTNDRTNIQTELDALSSELDRIGSVTEWAGQLLLNGDATIAGSVSTTASEEKSFTFQIGQGTSTADQYTLDIEALDTVSLALGSASTTYLTTSTIGTVSGSGSTTATLTAGTAVAATTSVPGSNTLTVGAAADRVETLTILAGGTTFTVTTGSSDSTTVIGAAIAAAFSSTGYTATASAGTVTFKNTTGSTVAGTTLLDVSDSTGANTAIDLLDTALNTVAGFQADLGAVSNRLDHTVGNLTNIATNLEMSKGRIEDADFATESTNLAKAQILSQAATAMLAQANTSKQGVLQLLQR